MIKKILSFLLIRITQFVILYVIVKLFFSNKEVIAYGLGIYLLITPATFILYLLILYINKIKKFKFVKLIIILLDFICFILLMTYFEGLNTIILNFEFNSNEVLLSLIYLFLGTLFLLNDNVSD